MILGRTEEKRCDQERLWLPPRFGAHYQSRQQWGFWIRVRMHLQYLNSCHISLGFIGAQVQYTYIPKLNSIFFYKSLILKWYLLGVTCFWYLIHEAGPPSRPVMIIVFAHVRSFVRPSVLPHFSKPNKFQAKTMFTTGETVGLAEWIIDDTCLVWISSLLLIVTRLAKPPSSKSP